MRTLTVHPKNARLDVFRQDLKRVRLSFMLQI
jgi:hypothetical protein